MAPMVFQHKDFLSHLDIYVLESLPIVNKLEGRQEAQDLVILIWLYRKLTDLTLFDDLFHHSTFYQQFRNLFLLSHSKVSKLPKFCSCVQLRA